MKKRRSPQLNELQTVSRAQAAPYFAGSIPGYRIRGTDPAGAGSNAQPQDC
jgi:hypothetical protein